MGKVCNKPEYVEGLDRLIRSATKEDICRLLWSKVQFFPSGCWVRMPLGKSFNPRLGLKGKRVGAHRLALFCATKTIPKGALCLHKCGFGKCVRPSHLYWGDAQQNSRDRIADYITAGKRRELCANLLGLFSDEEVTWIWEAFFVTGLCVQSISQEMKISYGQVTGILQRRRRARVTKDFVGDYSREKDLRKENRTLRSACRWLPHQKMPYLSNEQVVSIRLRLNAGEHPHNVAEELSLSRHVIKGIQHNRVYSEALGVVAWDKVFNKTKGTLSENYRSVFMHVDGFKMCSIVKFDGLVVKIWKLYHQHGMTQANVRKTLSLRDDVVKNVLSGHWRGHVTKDLPVRGMPGMSAAKLDIASVALDIYNDYAQGASSLALADKYKISKTIVMKIANKTAHTEKTKNLPRVNQKDRTQNWAGGKKIAAIQVQEIRRLHKLGHTTQDLARRYGLVSRSISQIVSRETWRWIR